MVVITKDCVHTCSSIEFSELERTYPIFRLVTMLTDHDKLKQRWQLSYIWLYNGLCLMTTIFRLADQLALKAKVNICFNNFSCYLKKIMKSSTELC
jgi:hypothetical protein